MPTIEPKPGDRIFTGEDGQLYFRRPTIRERIGDVLEIPVRFLISLTLVVLRALYQMVRP